MVNISCSIYLWCCTLQIYFTMNTFYSELFSKQLLFSAPTSGSFETLHNKTSLEHQKKLCNEQKQQFIGIYKKKKRWTLFFQNHYRSGTFSFFFREDLFQSFTRVTAKMKLNQFCCCIKEHWQNSVWSKKGRVTMKIVLREKCPNKEFFLVNIFPYLDQIWKIQTKENSIFGHFSHSAVWKLLSNDKNHLPSVC